jgi:hypothetical protein
MAFIRRGRRACPKSFDLIHLPGLRRHGKLAFQWHCRPGRCARLRGQHITLAARAAHVITVEP